MTIYNGIELLSPPMITPVRYLDEHLRRAYETGATKTLFKVFETFRDPARQRDLLKKRVSKAGPWESAHQYGLAVDFVPFLNPSEAIALGERLGEKVLPGWNWNSSHDYGFLASTAQKIGLATPIKWDPCHVQHPNFSSSWKQFRDEFEW